MDPDGPGVVVKKTGHVDGLKIDDVWVIVWNLVTAFVSAPPPKKGR